MSNIQDFEVPTIRKRFPKVERDYPISERENLMRAFNHEKPLWMPNYEDSSQRTIFGLNNADPRTDGEIYTSMWGVTYQYSAAQSSSTPIVNPLDCITNWKEKIVWPDLDEIDYTQSQPEGFVRDKNLAYRGHLRSACFEKLHMFLGFEQALIDLITEPQACREFFEALVDWHLAYFKRLNDFNDFDYVIYHDDWGTQRGPFFSLDLFRETILEPTQRLVKGVQDMGVKFYFHNCGLINDFVPDIVNVIKADALELQIINDISGLMKEFGDRISFEYQGPDPFFMHNPETTIDEVRAKAREVVDLYGAHANPGAGAILLVNAPSEAVYNAYMNEIYAYSLEKYKNL